MIMSIACRPRRPRSAASPITAAIGAKNGGLELGIWSAISQAIVAATADCAIRNSVSRSRLRRIRANRSAMPE
jgi:hypothetical protein